MSESPEIKSSKFTGIAWVLFAASATFSAFFLPFFILFLMKEASPILFFNNLFNGYISRAYNDSFFPWIFIAGFFILVIALYMGLYRTKTVLMDLGLKRFAKSISIVLGTIFIMYILGFLILMARVNF